MGLIKSLFGDYSKREIKRIQPLCDKVLGLEETYRAMSEEELEGPDRQAAGPAANGRKHRRYPARRLCRLPRGLLTGCSGCAPSLSRSSAVSSCTRGGSPK